MDLNDYQSQLYNLMPQGKAWPRDENSNLSALFLAYAVELARVDDRVKTLLLEAYPATAFELLDDWERVLGLPEQCAGVVTTLQGRRNAIVEKLARRGGQSRQFFIDLAARIGFTITISEFRPFLSGIGRSGDRIYSEDWRFVWQVNAPEETVQYFRSGQSSSGDALAEWGNELLECVISRLKPAHTVLHFGYSGS